MLESTDVLARYGTGCPTCGKRPAMAIIHGRDFIRLEPCGHRVSMDGWEAQDPPEPTDK